MALLHFQWTDEAGYRTRIGELLQHARSTSALSANGGLDYVFLSRGYQVVVKRTCRGLDAEQWREVYPIGVTYIEGCAVLAVAEGLVPAQLCSSLFLHQSEIVWIDSEGQEFAVDTVFGALDGKVIVATAREFPLDDRYRVDRQLFRAEVAYVCDELRRYKNRSEEN